MSRREMTGAIVDNLLRFAVGGGLLATILIAPNAVQIFDKPARKYLNSLDKRARQRELSRILTYMKSREFIAENYQHGLTVTKKGLRRIERRNFDNLTIEQPTKWDNTWRLVLFDIPQKYKHSRDALSLKIRELGFKPLQKSAWVHPFPCRDEITLVCQTYKIERFVSYLEISHIDNESALKKKFSNIL
ncbi:MAG: hypothetical protein ACXWLH_01930 [Candidatus Saccharimonadales bacterium]